MNWIRNYPQTPDYGMFSRMMFENGWGIEVSRGPQTIGFDQGLFEIRVLDSNGDYCDTTNVASGPVGNLTTQQVTDYMAQITSLK